MTAMGQREAAQACYQRTLALAPYNTEALFQLAHLTRHRGPPPFLSRLHRALVISEETYRRARLHFALGKIHDDLGEYDQAFHHIERGNRLLGPDYDERAHADYVQAQRANFPGAILPLAGAMERPVVLVVGMPRSGTTLVAQILSAHPAVHSVGEQSWLTEALKASGVYPHGWNRLPAAQRLETAKRYLHHFPSTPEWVLDKTPLNGFHLGAAGQLFAELKVIFCRRDPLDVGLSCFFQCFTQGHEYSRDLYHLGRYMRHYLALLEFWQQKPPSERWMEIAYEDLVCQPEVSIRRIVDFIGVPWHPACLNHQENPNPVRSASRWQVREPVHTRSIGRWRHYAPWLGPLRAGLAKGEIN